MKQKRIMPSSKVKKKPPSSRTAYATIYAQMWEKVFENTGKPESRKEREQLIRKIVSERLKSFSDEELEWLALSHPKFAKKKKN